MIKFLEKIKISDLLFGCFLLVIIVFGASIRLGDLGNNPSGLQYDEAQNGLKAIEIMESGDHRIFYSGENPQGGLYLNALAVSIKSFGVNNFSIKLVSAFFGILTLVGFYFLLKELKFSKLSILLGVFLLTTSFWHLVFSHIVYQEIIIPFVLVWLFYFFFLGIRTTKVPYFLLTGLFLGIGFYSSFPFWVSPLLLIVFLVFLAFYKSEFFKKYWKGILIFLLTFLITISPLIFYFYQNPSHLFELKSDNLIFNNPELSTGEALGRSLVAHINAFFFYGDPNQRHNQAGTPLIPPVWAILFVIGFALSLKDIIFNLINFKKKQVLDKLFRAALLAQIIFWIMLIPGILIIENIPNSLKILGTIPAVMIFILIPFEYILRLRENLKSSENFSLKPFRWKILNACLFFLILVVGLAGLVETYTYHFIWTKEPKTLQAFEREVFDFGKLAKQTLLKEKNILVVPDDVAIYDEGQKSAFKTAEFAGYPEIREFKFHHPLEAIASISEDCQGDNYVFFKADQWLLEQFQKECENFKLEKEKVVGGYYQFWVLKN